MMHMRGTLLGATAIRGRQILRRLGISDVTPDAFTLGGPYTVNPGETVQFPDVTVSGLDAGAETPFAVANGEMRVLDDTATEVSAWGVADTVNVQNGYVVQVRTTAPDLYGTTVPVELEGGDSEVETVSATANITTRSLTAIQDGAFVSLDGEGGAISYDIDGDGTPEGEIDEAEQAAQVGAAPRFDLAPSYTADGDTLTIWVGYPVWDGDVPRLRVEIRNSENALLTPEWDTDAGWAPDPSVPLTYDAAADSGILTIDWIASDEIDSTTVSDTFDAGATWAAPIVSEGNTEADYSTGGNAPLAPAAPSVTAGDTQATYTQGA